MVVKTNRIAVFYDGRVSPSAAAMRRAAETLGVDLELISFSRVIFDTQGGGVLIRGELPGDSCLRRVDEFDVVYFQKAGKYWEEIALLTESLQRAGVKVVDPVMRLANPMLNRKAHQMLVLSAAGLPVPRSVYGSLSWLCEQMGKGLLSFPVILKGSAGHGGANVHRAENMDALNALAERLWPCEALEGQRYLLQEYVENDGDYRILVLGRRALGAIKRCRTTAGEFRNNCAVGGVPEAVDLSEAVLNLAVRAAETCGLLFAGVDVIFRNDSPDDPLILEVNAGPQFEGFMKATGINVPMKLVSFLSALHS